MTGQEDRDYAEWLGQLLADGEADLQAALGGINVVAGLAAATSRTAPLGDGRTGISVLVVSDHPMWRDGIARELAESGFSVAGTACDEESAVRIARAFRPDVVLLDMNPRSLSGVVTTSRITVESPDTRVLVLSASGEHDDVLQAVKAGALGYIPKSVSQDELVDAVNHAAEGRPLVTAELAGLMIGEFRRLSSADDSAYAPRPTDRQMEVLRLVARGLSERQIANRLVMSYRSVGHHLLAAMRKLQLQNQVELRRD